MKEVFTKSFWEGVKKTFDEAREDPPPANTPSQTLTERDQQTSSTPEHDELKSSGSY